MKACLWCGVDMTRQRGESASNWNRRKTCSIACANRLRFHAPGPCIVDGCPNRRGNSRWGGYCETHWHKFGKGDPVAIPDLPRWTADRWIPPHRTPCMDYPELFFPPDGNHGTWDPRPAQALCGGCESRTSCLSWAMTEERPPVGVWGGVRFTDGAPVAVSA